MHVTQYRQCMNNPIDYADFITSLSARLLWYRIMVDDVGEHAMPTTLVL